MTAILDELVELTGWHRDYARAAVRGGVKLKVVKNWAQVRELVGYYRYDTAAELAKLNEIWALDAAFTNYFLPQQKLVFKQRNGAKVTKRHDQAETPHQRAVAHKDLGKAPVIAMNAAWNARDHRRFSNEATK